MEVVRIEDRVTERGPAEYFTGTVWLERIAANPPPSRQRVFRVTFEPRARTAWHTHPLGQVIHVLSGVARVQGEGGPVQTARAGDTVLIRPGERHWHGAAPGHTMVHLTAQEADENGSNVTWMEHVTDAAYDGG